MLTLSKGYKKPQTGDKGSVYFPAIEDDIQQLNDHNHDGANSQLISGAVVVAGESSVGAADWVLQTPGTYRFLVTLPAGYTVDATHKEVRIAGGPMDGSVIYPTMEKVSATTMHLYVNDNTLNLTVSFK